MDRSTPRSKIHRCPAKPATRRFLPPKVRLTRAGRLQDSLQFFLPLSLALSLVLCLALPGQAQEGPVTFEFSFSNPGARSLGLGGAFAALADDATAGFANPAGLVQLLEPELSLEGRSWSYDTAFVTGGRASGLPSGQGIDTVSGLRQGRSDSDLTDLSFVSAVVPAKRWSFSAYRHIWADFELASQVNGIFAEIDGETERSEDVQARTRVKVVNTGLAAGLKVSDSFSLGLALVYFEAEMDSFSLEYRQSEELLFQSNAFTPNLLDTSYSHLALDTGVVIHGGFLWRIDQRWSLGGYYRDGPEMRLQVLEIAGPAADESAPGSIELDAESPLHLPDVYGLGLAFRTKGGAWTVSFEWSRVLYSVITDKLNPEVFGPDQIETKDGSELHLGIELVLARARPTVALRLGAWRDPAHSVGSGPAADIFERSIFQSGDDEIHLAGGFGLVFPQVQIDLGADVSDEANLYSLSFVYRF